MRLALIRQRYNPFGGAERFIERAISVLERSGAEVTVITRAWEAGTGRRTLTVDPRYLGRVWRDASFSKGVREVLGREQFDLVQSHERIPGCDVYRAGDGVHRQWLAHRAKAAPFVERLGIRLNPYHWYTCAAERSMFEHPGLRAVICNSKMVAAEIRRHFAIAPDKLHVIYNGVDLEQFHPGKRKETRAAAREEFGCEAGDTVFSFVGSGFARKGLATAIDALAASGRMDFRLVVAGRDRASARFVAHAARAGVADRVVFTGGLDDVRPVLAASDCFILPTRYDPFPNAALEALAMGIPVIVSSQCGAAEVVEPGGSGWICEPDNCWLLARLMVEAAEAPRAGVGRAARSTAERYGIEAMAKRMIDLYGALLGGRSPGAADGH
jgi:UDP-glucose:(heptosyl)LPS alpha-1,3-glucosyltransferase